MQTELASPGYPVITGLANREYLRKELASKVGRQVYFIPLSKIKEREGAKAFNRRTDYGDIPAFAERIAVNGVEPLTVDVTDTGEVFVHKGHRRLRALNYLADLKRIANDLPGIALEDNAIISIECFVNGKNVTEKDRLLSQIYENDGKAFTFMETLNVLADAVNDYGCTHAELAASLNWSRQSIDNMLILKEANNANVFEGIEKNLLTHTAAVDLIRKLKEPEAISRMVRNAIISNIPIKVKDVKALVVAPVKDEEKQHGAGDAPEPAKEKEIIIDNLTDAKKLFKDSLSKKEEVVVPYDDTAEKQAAQTSNRLPDAKPDRQEKDMKEIKDETILCSDVIVGLDKIATMVKKLPGDEHYKNDIDREIHFMLNKMQDIKKFVIKAEIR